LINYIFSVADDRGGPPSLAPIGDQLSSNMGASAAQPGFVYHGVWQPLCFISAIGTPKALLYAHCFIEFMSPFFILDSNWWINTNHRCWLMVIVCRWHTRISLTRCTLYVPALTDDRTLPQMLQMVCSSNISQF
jgi:hypothetical protein